MGKRKGCNLDGTNKQRGKKRKRKAKGKTKRKQNTNAKEKVANEAIKPFEEVPPFPIKNSVAPSKSSPETTQNKLTD